MINVRTSLIVIFLVLLSISSQGKDVDIIRAGRVASLFFQRNDPARGSDVVLQSRTDFMYIYVRKTGGFVIVSASDAARPVLGYSYTESLDCCGDGAFKEWMQDMGEQIACCRESSSEADSRVSAMWTAAEVSTKADNSLKPQVKHETALWNQTEPFNKYTPVVDGEKSVTGCGPLSMAILMRFYEWPPKGSGTLLSYTYTSEKGTSCHQAGHELGHEYDWSKMKMSYQAGQYSEEEADAAARLIYDCGVMAKASFGRSTAVNLPDIASSMIEHMGYDAGINYYYKGYFSNDVWEDMLKKELQDHPIIYRGRTATIGHIFIIDGYDTDGHFSVNWGKGGTNNGYFALDAMIYGNTSYNLEQAAFFSLKPDQGGLPLRYLAYEAGTYSGQQYDGIELVSGKIAANEVFTVKTGLRNCGLDTFDGEIIVALLSADGTVKELVSDPVEFKSLNTRLWRGIPSISCCIKGNLENGDRICVLFRYDGEKQWRPALANREKSVTGFIEFKDECNLAKASSIRYDKAKDTFTIKTKPGASCKLLKADGSQVDGAVSFADGSFVIKPSTLPKKEYKLLIELGDESFGFSLTMGK